ncbi:unnamed protein product [Trichogramma brassicae]|uniref:Uncharacterized protein n=1 Tax=Trichogramma brassicae TaxID=86971 RepID=A0A6H5J1I6_9HYME|nr:unnamed protein product [Trichogramma brassicae]
MAAARAIDATMMSARVPARRGTHVLIPAMRLVVQRGQSAPMLSARSRRQHTHTDALFTAYRRCGTRQSHSNSHTHAYARDPAVASTNNLDKNLKLTPNLRRLDVGSAPLLNYTLALVRASMVYVPAGCGLMPTSGRWSSMLVHSCTGSYKPDWANCFTGELRHEHANLHTGPSGRTCLTGDFHEHVHTVTSPSRRRFSRRTLRFVFLSSPSTTQSHFAHGLSLTSKTAFTTVQRSHVSSCCGLELICRDLLCVGRSAIAPLSVSLARIRRRTCRDSLLAAAAAAAVLATRAERRENTHTHTHAHARYPRSRCSPPSYLVPRHTRYSSRRHLRPQRSEGCWSTTGFATNIINNNTTMDTTGAGGTNITISNMDASLIAIKESEEKKNNNLLFLKQQIRAAEHRSKASHPNKRNRYRSVHIVNN